LIAKHNQTYSLLLIYLPLLHLQSRKKNYDIEKTLKTVIIFVLICILLYMVHSSGSQSKKSEQKKKEARIQRHLPKSLLHEKHKSLRTNTNTTLLRAPSHGEEISRFSFRGGDRQTDRTSTFCVTSLPHLRMFPAQFPQAKRSVKTPTPTS
jgi:hypothetical protein